MALRQWLFCGLLLCLVTGCNSMRTTVAPELQGRVVSLEKVGIGGAGASQAVPGFIDAGYLIVELGASGADVISRAREMNVSHVVIVDAPDTKRAWWDGMFTFAMRVSDTKTGSVVWSGSATYGHAGLYIDQQGSAKDAFHDLVLDLAKYLPPKNPATQPAR